MTQINVLELALRDPSRLTADLAGHTHHRTNALPGAGVLRRSRPLLRGRRVTTGQ
jgi:hypothetical protein